MSPKSSAYLVKNSFVTASTLNASLDTSQRRIGPGILKQCQETSLGRVAALAFTNKILIGA